MAQFLNQLKTVIALPAFTEKNSKSEFPNIQAILEAKRLKDIDWDTLLRTIKDAEHAISGVSVIKIKNNDHNISGLVLRGTAENSKLFIISKIFLRSLAIPECGEYLRRCITQNEKPS